MRANAYPSAKSLPFFVGMPRGIFEPRSVRVELQFTPNSEQQREGLAAGALDGRNALDSLTAYRSPLTRLA